VSILAVLVSPLVALQVSSWLAKRKERRERRLYVFRTLMATRASGLAAEHVQALNLIDIEFHGSDAKSKAVLNAWKAYLDHLGISQTDGAVWGAKREDLFVDLLYEISRYLGYGFDRTHIRRTSYFPRGYGDLESDQLAIRKGLAAIMKGQASFPIFLTGMNSPTPDARAAPALPEGDPGSDVQSSIAPTKLPLSS
jgi:hypothetical protein